MSVSAPGRAAVARQSNRQKRQSSPRPISGGATPRRGALARVHTTHEGLSPVELEPPHPPRKETPIYQKTHRRLIVVEDRPCYICGVRRSDLQVKARRNDPRINPYRATAMESHHWPIERSLLAAVDPELLAQAYPTVRQFKSLEEWVDSEYNLLVLCDRCHRLADHAIHRALWQDVIATKFALRDASGGRFEFAATTGDAAQVEAADETLVEEVAASSAPPAAADTEAAVDETDTVDEATCAPVGAAQ